VAASPKNPAAPLKVSISAPLEEDVALLAVDEAVLVDDETWLVLRPLAVLLGLPALPEVEVAGVPMGAVVVPAISDATDELKVPVIPDRVNLAENPRAGNWALVGSGRASDWKRMKYMSPLLPMVASGLNTTDWVDPTLTEP